MEETLRIAKPPVTGLSLWHPSGGLNFLRRSGHFTDAVIQVGSQLFLVHRAIMATCSPYFKALFLNERFNTKGRHHFIIPGVTADMMQRLVQFAYTRHVTITTDIVEQLLPAADQFHMNGVVSACCQFLFKHLAPENCIGIHKFAHAYFCRNLSQDAHKYLMQNFSRVSMLSNEFLQLDADELSDLLSKDELNVKTEGTVFEALIRWIDFNPDCRAGQIGRLLPAVRLGLMNQAYLNKVKDHGYVKESDACKSLITQVQGITNNLQADDNNNSCFSNPLGRPRVPHELIFVIGGWSAGSPTNMMEVYDSRANKWVISDTADEFPRAYQGTVTYGRQIYILGGFDGVDYFNSVRRFDPVLKTWTEVAPMNKQRCYVSVAVLNGYIYACGGFDGSIRHRTAERYNPVTNQWSFIKAMNNRRSDADAAALNDKLYICGGFNGNECLNNAEVYNPRTNQWSILSRMLNRRSGLSVISYRNYVYAIGGFNGTSRIALVERYHPATNSWHNVSSMITPRSNFAVEVIDDKIYAMGGFNGVTTIFNVEYLNDADNKWYEAKDMNLFRSALGACVISELPNVKEYTHYGASVWNRSVSGENNDQMA